MLASDAAWKEVELWNKRGEVCVDCGAPRGHPDADCDCGQVGAIGNTRRPRVFCASMADWLDPMVPVEWLARLLDLIRRTPNLDWLLLTKRPDRFRERVSHVALMELNRDNNTQFVFAADWARDVRLPPNVWFGVSSEDQKRWDERVPVLLSIPARVRFVSVEPMLGPIDMNENWMLSGHGRKKDKSLMPRGSREHVDWVIFGGESGAKARPCNVDWIRDGLRQCRDAGVAPFVKQLGVNAVQDLSAVIPEASDEDTQEDPMAAAQWDIHRHQIPMRLKDRKGGDPSEWPEDLRVREWPTI